MSASCAFCEENCSVFACIELSESGSDFEKVDIYCNLSGKSGPIFRASGPWRIPIVARSHACRRICALLWSCLPGVCFRLGCVLWRIRLEKGDGPQAERGELAARKEGRNDAFASRSAMGKQANGGKGFPACKAYYSDRC